LSKNKDKNLNKDNGTSNNSSLNVAFVGGGKGCKEILELLQTYRPRTFKLNIIGVADFHKDAPGRKFAEKIGIWTTENYKEFFKYKELDLLIELTGKDEVLDEIYEIKPKKVKVLDHVGARFLWEIIEIQEEKLVLEERLAASEKMIVMGEMAYHLAHELRNPLMCIGGLARRILHYPHVPEGMRHRLQLIIQHVEQMERAVSHVCDVAKPLQPRFCLCDMKAIMNELCKGIRLEAETKGILVECNIGDDLPTMVVDPDLFRQAIWHVVKNAIEAMENIGGRLTITAELCWDDLVLIIKDTGPGIENHLKDQVFRPFYTTKPGSAGLGLSLCRKIIWDHGGEISIKKGEEGGTIVRFDIPVRFEIPGAPPI